MFTKRIIPCLDVNDGRVVKGVNFVNLIDAGDPVAIAEAYDKAGADELVFLDITASSDARNTVVDMVRKVAEKVFIPFTVGGGIRTVDDFKAFLQAQYAAGTPLKVYFETSQSSQLQGQLHLHKGTNILTSTATVEPTGMTAEYYSSKEV